MHRDGDSRLSLVIVKPVVDLLDVIVFAGESLACDRHHANRVFVYILVEMFSGKPVIARLHRHNPWLDVEIAQKLFPDICTLPPVTMFGLLESFPAFFRASLQFHLWARPPSIQASEEPIVAAP